MKEAFSERTDELYTGRYTEEPQSTAAGDTGSVPPTGGEPVHPTEVPPTGAHGSDKIGGSKPKKELGASRARTKKTGKKRAGDYEILFRVMPILFVALAIFIAISLVFPSLLGLLGDWTRSFLFGIFGIVAFASPVLLFFSGLSFEKDWLSGAYIAKALTALLFMIFASAVCFTFGIAAEEYAVAFQPAVAYGLGAELRGGGVLGNLVGYALVSVLSPVGVLLLFLVIALLFLTVCFNLDLRKLVRMLGGVLQGAMEKRKLKKTLRAEAEEKRLASEAAARQEEENKRREAEAKARRREAEAEEARRREAAFADAPTDPRDTPPMQVREGDKTERFRKRRNESLRGRSSENYPLDNDLFYRTSDKVTPLRPLKKEEESGINTSYPYGTRRRDAAVRSRPEDLNTMSPETMEDFRKITTTAPIHPPVTPPSAGGFPMEREHVGEYGGSQSPEIISENSALPPYNSEPIVSTPTSASGFFHDNKAASPYSAYDPEPINVEDDLPPFEPSSVIGKSMPTGTPYMPPVRPVSPTPPTSRSFSDNDSYTAAELKAGNARFAAETARPFGAPPTQAPSDCAAPTSGGYAPPTQGGLMSERTVYFPSQNRGGEDSPRRGFDFSSYRYPDPSFLLPQDRSNDDALDAQVRENMQTLIRTLDSFGVSVEPRSTTRGPRITRYEIVPSFGVRINAITNLQNEIAMNLRAKSIRIEAPIPGDSAVGIEVPNQDSKPVRLRSLIDTEEFRTARDKTMVALGADIAGKPIYAKISSMPHMLVAGATGMGKSVCINTIITSILYKARPDEVRLILVDPKMVEFNIYEGIPHLLVPVINDVKQAIGALNWAADEMNRRFSLISKAGARDLDSYAVARERKGGDMECLPRIVIIIDELNDLVLSMKNSKPLDDVICKIAQKARAAGIHLLIGTQRPTVNVITGNIKANIPSRIAFKVSQKNDSMTILDSIGAEKLLGAGDMLYLKNSITRVQGCLVETGEIEKVVGFLRANSDCDMYDESAMRGIDRATSIAAEENSKGDAPAQDNGGHVSPDERVFWDAVDIFMSSERASTSLLQRKLSIGYGRAAKLIDKMEELGIVSSGEDKKARELLVTRDDIQKMRASLAGRDIFDIGDTGDDA